MSFLPDFGNASFTVIAFIIAIMVIVSVHEYGHYIVGRWTGIKADVFSIGMGPKIWSRVDKHGTRWQIAALPIGGYVKFRGDADASSGKADAEAMQGLTDEERRATMHGAPVWARALTVLAGPFANFILSAFIFAGSIFYMGQATDPLTIGTLEPIAGLEGTLQPGDELVAIEGETVPSLEFFSEFANTLPRGAMLTYTVNRKGEKIDVEALHPLASFVSSVAPRSAARAAGLEAGDLITEIDGVAMATFEDIRDMVAEKKDSELNLTVLRGEETLSFTMTPRLKATPLPGGGFEERYLIGITGSLIFTPQTGRPPIGETMLAGITQVWATITTSISGLYHIVSGKISTCNLNGAIGIAQTAGAAADAGIADFIWMIAALSTAIGFLNLLPVPVLDGGHLIFHLYEAVFRRPPNDKVLAVMMTVGLVMVLSLMLFGLSNDIFCE